MFNELWEIIGQYFVGLLAGFIYCFCDVFWPWKAGQKYSGARHKYNKHLFFDFTKILVLVHVGLIVVALIIYGLYKYGLLRI